MGSCMCSPQHATRHPAPSAPFGRSSWSPLFLYEPSVLLDIRLIKDGTGSVACFASILFSKVGEDQSLPQSACTTRRVIPYCANILG